MKLLKKHLCAMALVLVPGNSWSSANFYANKIQAKKMTSLHLKYCELVHNPDYYNGKEVTVRATYSYGLELQDLLCLDCRNDGYTYLELDEKYYPKIKSVLKKLPKDAGTINADFTGVFVSANGPFGHQGSYRYKFILTNMSHIEVIYKGLAPHKQDLSKKMCGGLNKFNN